MAHYMQRELKYSHVPHQRYEQIISQKKKKKRYEQIEYWLFILIGLMYQYIIKAETSSGKAWGSVKWGILCKEN